MRWIAIAYGALAGLVLTALSIGLGVLVLSTGLGISAFERYPDLMSTVILVNRMLVLISYPVAGAIAGGVAMKAGALHGALAALGCGIASRALALALTIAMYGPSTHAAPLQTWISSLGWVAVGVAIGAVAGALTVAYRTRQPTAAAIAP